MSFQRRETRGYSCEWCAWEMCCQKCAILMRFVRKGGQKNTRPTLHCSPDPFAPCLHGCKARLTCPVNTEEDIATPTERPSPNNPRKADSPAAGYERYRLPPPPRYGWGKWPKNGSTPPTHPPTHPPTSSSTHWLATKPRHGPKYTIHNRSKTHADYLDRGGMFARRAPGAPLFY